LIFTSLILIVFHFDISILKLYSSHILVSLSIKKRESYKKKTEIVAKKKKEREISHFNHKKYQSYYESSCRGKINKDSLDL
jgi:hypothetical protein